MPLTLYFEQGVNAFRCRSVSSCRVQFSWEENCRDAL